MSFINNSDVQNRYTYLYCMRELVLHLGKLIFTTVNSIAPTIIHLVLVSIHYKSIQHIV